MDSKIFKGIYQGKRVLVTGHTGFKGAWLTCWLNQLGAEVVGFSKYYPSTPCLFNVLGLKKDIRHIQGDITDFRKTLKIFQNFKPQIVFHLAAQPIVRMAYQDPKQTFDTNIGGTVNLLECVRLQPTVEALVVITSDKCYENLNIKRGYHEKDRLGGEDPYSASKACAELAFSAYYRSFFNYQDKTLVASARAGNVIGGGDWAQDRIIPDCVRALSIGRKAVIRNPQATRPWQHVLEPLSGYLWLGCQLLLRNKNIHGQSFNFGPFQRASKNVGQLADVLVTQWGNGAGWEHIPSVGKKKEALLLQLSPQKTKLMLGWRSVLSFKETVSFTALWYKEFYGKKMDMINVTQEQIQAYIAKAKNNNLLWARI